MIEREHGSETGGLCVAKGVRVEKGLGAENGHERGAAGRLNAMGTTDRFDATKKRVH